MVKKKVNVSGKLKHSLDVNRSNDAKKESRSAATVRRLKMYNTRPVRDRRGKVVSNEFQSKELPSTRIQPDCRWFGNTRVVNQKELEFFREELQNRMSSNYNVILREKKLPLSLLNDHQKKAPSLLVANYESLLKKADGSQEAFEQKYGSSVSAEANDGDGFRDLVRHTMFEKGQSKRIWGELYKVIDSLDVVVQCDLVPAWATKGWLRVLSKEFPTLAFHANINKSFGKVCKVAPIPGETKVWQCITLTKRIFLIDCPGVVYHNHDSETDVVLKGVVRVTILQDAVNHIGEVLKRVKKEHLERAYRIKEWDDENDFLLQLCKSTGKLLKGGEPDLMTAAKMVLHDWQRRRIPFFVPPPRQDDLSEEPNVNGVNLDDAVDGNEASAAITAIADVLSSQQ
ncbi:Nuclear/nucleolar GTPase 2 [Spatholobus suberectus]|nr:Nuclear/nucleolar GTPase 2 [Spatholobus suberectus]